MKKISITSIIIIVLLVVLIIDVYRQQHYCKQTQPYDLPCSDKQYASVSDYLAATSNREKVENNPTDTIKTFFMFANNAYNFDEKSMLVITTVRLKFIKTN
jgi:hypothetical protein